MGKSLSGRRRGIYPWGDEFDPGRSNHGNSQLAPWMLIPRKMISGYLISWEMYASGHNLVGEKLIAPDPSYGYRWRADRRNDLGASSQIRRVIRGASFAEDASTFDAAPAPVSFLMTLAGLVLDSAFVWQ